MLRWNQFQSSMDRNRQRLTKVFNPNFDWSKKNFDRSKFWKKQIFEKWTNQFIEETPQCIERIKCMSMRWNVFQKHKFWNQFSKNLRFSIHSLKFSSIKYDLHKTLQKPWKGIKVLLALGEKALAKRMEETNKKISLQPWPRRIEREALKNFLKSKFGHVKIRFEKLFIRFSIDRKLDSIDRKCFDGTNFNQAWIETDRGWPKFLIPILIDRKRISIDRNFGKSKFSKKEQTNLLQKLLKALKE